MYLISVGPSERLGTTTVIRCEALLIPLFWLTVSLQEGNGREVFRDGFCDIIARCAISASLHMSNFVTHFM